MLFHLRATSPSFEKVFSRITHSSSRALNGNFGTGNDINFWHDIWLPTNFVLKNLIQGPLANLESTLILSELFYNGQLHLQKLFVILPPTISTLIQSTNFNTRSPRPTNSASFQIKSAHSVQNQHMIYIFKNTTYLPLLLPQSHGFRNFIFPINLNCSFG